MVLCGCVPVQQGSESTPMPGDLHRLLQSEFEKRLARYPHPVDLQPEQIQMVQYPSVVFPGLTYHWASYRVPEIDHQLEEVVVGALRTKLRVLETPSDWTALVGATTIEDARSATELCIEWVLMLSSFRSGEPRSRIYRDSIEVNDAVLYPGTVGPPLSPPRAVAVGDGWEVKLWSLEIGAVREYQCFVPVRIGAQATATMIVTQTVHGRGFFEPGP